MVAVKGKNEVAYTSGSWAGVIAALRKAEAPLDLGGVTSAQAESATREMKDTITRLEYKTLSFEVVSSLTQEPYSAHCQGEGEKTAYHH